MNNTPVIGIDMGATNIRAGIVRDGVIKNLVAEPLQADATPVAIVQQLTALIDPLFNDGIAAIGIGVPALVDEERGLVLDALNIAKWHDLPLKNMLSERFEVPVLVNNDANCFALGEYRFGKGSGSRCFVGMSIGTGLGCGIVSEKGLFSGSFCGAGEFGMMPYLDHPMEYHASGQFFQNVFGISGEEAFQRAEEGDKQAVAMFDKFGGHLGHAVVQILFALAPDRIVLGGSVAKAWKFFEHSMKAQLEGFAFRSISENLTIGVSELDNAGIIGAAALYADSVIKQ